MPLKTARRAATWGVLLAVVVALWTMTSFHASASSSPSIEGASPAGPAVEVPPPADDMLWLQSQMATAIQIYWVPGDYAVAVTDLQTGESVDVNGDRPLLSGCVVNLFALFQAARDLWMSKYQQDYVDSLICATIWSSNATTAHELYGVLGDGDITEGVRRVDQLIHGVLGIDGVALDHPPAY